MQEGFLFTDVDELERFFTLVGQLKEDTKEARMAIIRQMVAEKQVKYLRDPQEFIKDKNVITETQIKGDTQE